MVQNLLQVLQVTLLFRDVLEFLLLPGFDTQIESFHFVLDTGQGGLNALRLVELHNGKHALGMQRITITQDFRMLNKNVKKY